MSSGVSVVSIELNKNTARLNRMNHRIRTLDVGATIRQFGVREYGSHRNSAHRQKCGTTENCGRIGSKCTRIRALVSELAFIWSYLSGKNAAHFEMQLKPFTQFNFSFHQVPIHGWVDTQ